MKSDARARKACAMARSLVLDTFCILGLNVLVYHAWAPLVFGLTARRARDLIRFGTRDRMTGRRTRFTNAVKHGPSLLTFSFSWRTPFSHNSASTQFSRITRDASAAGNPVSTN